MLSKTQRKSVSATCIDSYKNCKDLHLLKICLQLRFHRKSFISTNVSVSLSVASCENSSCSQSETICKPFKLTWQFAPFLSSPIPSMDSAWLIVMSLGSSSMAPGALGTAFSLLLLARIIQGNPGSHMPLLIWYSSKRWDLICALAILQRQAASV